MMKKLLLIMMALFTLCFGILLGSQSFAEEGYTTIMLSEAGNSSVTPIFTSDGFGAAGPWYPGYSASSVLRIRNGYGQKVNIEKMGMSLSLKRDGVQLDTVSKDGQDYMNKMKMRVEYKNPVTRLVKGTAFNGSFAEFCRGVDSSFSIPSNDYVDLEYTIEMDESAEVNLAGITAEVDFMIGMAGTWWDDTGDTGSNDNEGKKEPEITFTDLDGHWAHDCIITLVRHGIVKGYPDGKIGPDYYITRAETAVLLGKALKLESKEKQLSGYIDSLPEWAHGYIVATTEKGVFTGYPFKMFMPGKYITRQEMTVVLGKAFLKEGKGKAGLAFTDRDKIEKWAEEYVKAALDRKIIEGYPDNTFRPNHPITRAEAFTILCKLLGYHSEHK